MNHRRLRPSIAVAALCATSICLTGCDDQPSTPDDESPSEGASLQLVVPSHETTPAVELTFQITSVDDDDLESLQEPVGNVIYLAIRDCPDAHPDDDSEEIRAAALNFSIDGGEVTDVEQRDAKLRQDRAVHVSENGQRCLLDEVADHSVELGDEWSDVEFDVASQVEMYW